MIHPALTRFLPLNHRDRTYLLLNLGNIGRLLLVLALAVVWTAATPRSVLAICPSNGTLDPTWNGTGVALTNFGTNADQVRSVAIQSDGKIVVAGSSHNMHRFALARYNTDGTPDLTFGTEGKVETSFALNGNDIGSSFATTVAIQPDGKIVAGGAARGLFTSMSLFTLARYNVDGSLDGSFGDGGKLTIFVGFGEDRINSLLIQPDGKIVAGGYADNIGNRDFAVVRLRPNGSLDPSWGTGGKVITAFGSVDHRIASLAIQSDGKIVAGGNSVVVRYNTNGTLDTSWGGTGIVSTSQVVTSVAVQPDGKVVAGGWIWLGFESDSAVARFNTDGTPDTTWDGDGSVVTRVGATDDEFHTVAIQSDGKVVAAGFSYYGFTIVRYNRYGALDASWGGTGIVITINEGAYRIRDLVIQPDGKIVAAGYNNVGTAQAFAVARYAGCVSRPVFDFDGDGRTDASVFREGTWYINPSSNPNSYYGQQWGLPADLLVPADYDGDGKTDIAVWRKNVVGPLAYFYILESSTNTFRSEQFGSASQDSSVAGDWDGDGKADLALHGSYDDPPFQSYIIYRSSLTNLGPTILWGIRGDEPLLGDFDGDGRMDAAVYRPSNNVWYIRQSSNSQVRYEYAGVASDKRVSGDFDGDGKTDIAIYRDGLWAVLQSSNNQGRFEYWGLGTDKLVPGDYNGDGRTDFAVWRDGDYWILDSATQQYTYRRFGQAGDVPVASVFIR